MNSELSRQVWLRAASRCEYCKLPADLYPGAFCLDHIIAKQHGGATDLSNLALSCLHCNSRKGPNIAGIDPLTGTMTRLYHPRSDAWTDHFLWRSAELGGKTMIGRTTIHVLNMNERDFLAMRIELAREGEFGEMK